MKNELRNIIKSDSFKEYKRLENKLWETEERSGCFLAIAGYIILLIILMPQLFPIKDFGDVFLFLFIVHLMPIPLLLYGIFIAIISSTYDKVYKFFINKTTTFKRYKELKLKNKPLEDALKKEIENYIKHDFKKVLADIRIPQLRENAKAKFVENYSFLKEADKELGYVPDLFNFLKECKSIIKGFYAKTTINTKDTINENNQNLIQEEPVEETTSQKKNNTNRLSSKFSKVKKKIRKLSQTATRKKTVKKNENKRIVKPQKINWDELNKIKSNIGLIGEKLVLAHERNKLIELEMYEYLPRLEHVSETKGDGLGYDIVSFDEGGNRIYIEVKTTTKDLYNDIFFTRNELYKMNKLGESYNLYRVYDLNLNSGICEIEILIGADTIKNQFDFYTESVRAKLKKERKPGHNNV